MAYVTRGVGGRGKVLINDSGGLCPKDPLLEIVFLANKYNLQFSFNINKKLLQNDLKMHISDRNLPKKFPGGQAPEPSAGGGTPPPPPSPSPAHRVWPPTFETTPPPLCETVQCATREYQDTWYACPLHEMKTKVFYFELHFSKMPKESETFTNTWFDSVVTSSGYHNRLGERTERHKQSLWVVIRVLKDEERLVRLAAQRVDMGFPTPKKLKYRKLEHRIRKLKRQYRHGQKSLYEYWDAVTHLLCRVT